LFLNLFLILFYLPDNGKILYPDNHLSCKLTHLFFCLSYYFVFLFCWTNYVVNEFCFNLIISYSFTML
jgi:hypothetical protein